MEQALAFMAGTIAVIAGLSLVLRPNEWLDWMKFMRQQGTSSALWLGYLHLMIGTFIIGLHPKWQGLPLVLTLIGVKATIEGTIYLLFPKVLIALLGWYEPLPPVWFRLAGLIVIVIGLAVLGEWNAPKWFDRASNNCFYQECAVG